MKKGDIVVIYTDPYWNLGYEGEAELLEYKGEGLPFILEENKDKWQITYSHKKWLVKMGNFTCIRKIRYKISTSGTIHNDGGYIRGSGRDRFLEIDGKQIY